MNGNVSVPPPSLLERLSRRASEDSSQHQQFLVIVQYLPSKFKTKYLRKITAHILSPPISVCK